MVHQCLYFKGLDNAVKGKIKRGLLGYVIKELYR